MQMLRRPKAVWYLGGQISQVEEVHSSSALKSISAVHFPPDVWRQQYSSSLPAGSEATDKQPSALWIGETSLHVASSMSTTALTVRLLRHNLQCCQTQTQVRHVIAVNDMKLMTHSNRCRLRHAPKVEI